MRDRPWQKKKSSGSGNDDSGDDEQKEIASPMNSWLFWRALNPLRRDVVCPGEYERDRKTYQQKRDHEPQTPIRQFPCWKRCRGDLNQESRGNDVSGSDAVNLTSLQLLEEAAHNICGSIMTIAPCCGFAGKYVSETDVLVACSFNRSAFSRINAVAS